MCIPIYCTELEFALKNRKKSEKSDEIRKKLSAACVNSLGKAETRGRQLFPGRRFKNIFVDSEKELGFKTRYRAKAVLNIEVGRIDAGGVDFRGRAHADHGAGVSGEYVPGSS